MVSALVWGTRGRRFKSGRPDVVEGKGTIEPSPSATQVSETRVLTLPNVLSFLRLLSMPVFAWLFATGNEEAAIILFSVAASSDFFDGYLARRTNSVTELGRLLDPLADRLLIMALAIALVVRGTMPLALALAVIGRDVLLLAAWPLLERRKIERIRVNFVGKSATAAHLIGLASLAWSETSLPAQRFADEVGMAYVLLGAVLYWVAGFMYADQARRRLRQTEGAS